MQPKQTVIWEPQPGPQTALITCPVEEVFYGGARGGGKTEASIGDWLLHSSTYGENAIGIFVRRKLTQLSEVIARTQQLFSKINAKYHVQTKTWVMPGGGRLKFVYLENDSDAEEYQGHSYTRVYVEEVCNFPSASPINKLRATLRSGAGVPCAMRLTGNPGGPGHTWVKARYIDPCPQGNKVINEYFACIMTDEPIQVSVNGKVMETPLYGVHPIIEMHEDGTCTIQSEALIIKILQKVDIKVGHRVFIPSKISDNKKLMENDPMYVLRLRQAGSDALVKAWLTGNWDVVEGAYFNEFDSKLHVLSDDLVTEILQLNTSMRFRAMDWGSAKPSSIGWYVLLANAFKVSSDFSIPAGALVRFKEWYTATKPNVGCKYSADTVAKGVIERDKGLMVKYGVADPAIFIRNGGPSIAEMMAIPGCNWRPADNKRIPGWEQVHNRLHGVSGAPLLYFAESNTDMLRTLPVLQHSDTRPEDLDTDAEDHAADELRYACMSRPWISKQPQVTAIQAHPAGLATVVDSSGKTGITFNHMLQQVRRSKENLDA